MTSSQCDLDTALWSLDFEISKSIRYHAYRRSFWEGLDRSTKIFTTISGTAILVSVIGESSGVTKLFAIMVAVASIGDVVIGFSSKAKLHNSLYRDFSLLSQHITSTPPTNEDDLRRLQRRRLEIEMEEPGISDLLERRCAAEECKARGCELREAWKLTRFQVLISQWAFWPARA